MATFGIHIGLQDTTPDEVISLANAAEALGFDWVSTWDHFFSASPDSSINGSLEAVAMQTAVATATERVRVGTLVYSTSYRHPAVIAKAAATIDQLSNGRAEIGLGAGFSPEEHAAFGLALPPLGERMDRFDEAVQCVTALLREDIVDFEGRYFRLDAAHCSPAPTQARLPVWVGGRGERRTLKIAAMHADGWNSAFLSVEDFARKLQILHSHCDAVHRDRATIATSINVGIGLTDEMLEQHHRTLGDPERTRNAAAVVGHGQQLVEQIGSYVEAGADQVNFTFRAPFPREALETLATAVAQLRSLSPE